MNAEVQDLHERLAQSWPTNLPRPTGYFLLIALPEVETKTKGGIVLAEQTVDNQRMASICGHVMDMGPDAYKDPQRFPSGPWCKVGDWVLMRAYSGTRFKVDGVEYRMKPDDSIEGVVEDPRGVVIV
jgi:co-chaperonin GroES (HSP10)